MENERIKIGEFSLKYYCTNTLVIGSGAASLNAAVSLKAMGQSDILIVTSKWGGGTSNNAGSDKQTYYKLSLSGDDPDSVRSMARDLFNGRCMHGDIALCEAQGSVQAFIKLVNLGVPFPHDKFGSWAGYRTDNDPGARATSAGPWTSRMIFKALSGEVKRLKIKVLDRHHIIALLTDETGSKVIGAIGLDTREKIQSKALVLFNATNIILGTGGPGDLYASSVYPRSQNGSAGMAFRAGATGQNLTESQFGIASLKFRWNLSGSYQQVIPRYFSTDLNGKGEHEFLNEHFPDYKSLSGAIFLKGYQWPFDASKIRDYGSSLIDVLVFREKELNKRRVFLDYRRNISWNGNDEFSVSRLGEEAAFYLGKSASIAGTPYERLLAINAPAVDLYREQGIDLRSEPLEIGVCVQHNNGGLKGNIWWESDLRHLFPVGEVNGSHGVYRPGGAALNSGQVGSYRAAQFISSRYGNPPFSKEEFLGSALKQAEEIVDMSVCFLSNAENRQNREIARSMRDRMSSIGGIIRIREKVTAALGEAIAVLKNFREIAGAASVRDLSDCFRVYNNCLLQVLYLDSIREYIERGGRSRGSFLIIDEGDALSDRFSAKDLIADMCKYDREVETGILEVKFSEENVRYNLVKARDVPDQDLWFEKVWRDYLKDNISGG